MYVFLWMQERRRCEISAGLREVIWDHRDRQLYDGGGCTDADCERYDVARNNSHVFSVPCDDGACVCVGPRVVRSGMRQSRKRFQGDE
jgi:hypothetical protein